jgi:hypothetical protein
MGALLRREGSGLKIAPRRSPGRNLRLTSSCALEAAGLRFGVALTTLAMVVAAVKGRREQNCRNLRAFRVWALLGRASG